MKLPISGAALISIWLGRAIPTQWCRYQKRVRRGGHWNSNLPPIIAKLRRDVHERSPPQTISGRGREGNREGMSGGEPRLDTNRLPNCRRGALAQPRWSIGSGNISHQARSELRNKDGFVKIHLTSVKVGWQDRRYKLSKLHMGTQDGFAAAPVPYDFCATCRRCLASRHGFHGCESVSINRTGTGSP